MSEIYSTGTTGSFADSFLTVLPKLGDFSSRVRDLARIGVHWRIPLGSMCVANEHRCHYAQYPSVRLRECGSWV